MWFLIFFTMLNSVLKQYSFVNVNRLQFGVMQIGVVEVFLVLGVVWAFLRGGINRSKFPTPVSSGFIALLVMLVIGLVFGFLGSMRSDVGLKDSLASGREFGSIALCMYMGYQLTATPKLARRFAYWQIIAGTVTGLLLLYGFNTNAEKATLAGNLNPLRSVMLDFNSEYTAVAALFLVYCLVIGAKVMSRPVMFLLAIFTFIAYLATLSRTGSLALGFGLLAGFFILPKGKRTGKMVKAATLGCVIGFSIFASLLAADALVGRNFLGKLGKHFEEIMPKGENDTGPKAYASRMAAAQIELGIWLENPLMGQGFAVQDTRMRRGQIGSAGFGYNHNGWTSTLAKTGIPGFIGCAGTILGMMYLGWRITRDATDNTDLIIGCLAFACGSVFFVRACCSMAFTSRAAIDFAMVCGVVLRYREMQRAKNAALLEFQAQPAPVMTDQLDWGYPPDHGAGHPAPQGAWQH